MKALISPNEVFTHTQITSWKQENQRWVPDTTVSIENCQRIAQVEQDNNIFDVAQPLYWVECPDECKADDWYYKDGQFQPKPTNALRPE